MMDVEESHQNVNGLNIKSEEEENIFPFYLMRPAPKEEGLNGSTNLILHNERQHEFNKYCCKKVKESLSAFIPDFPGNIDTTVFFDHGEESKETSTLSSLLDPKFQTVQNEIYPLTGHQLSSFRLYADTGPLPEKYMVMVQTNLPSLESGGSGSKKSKKNKRASNEGENPSSEKKKKKKEKKKKKDKDKEKEKEKDKDKEKKDKDKDKEKTSSTS